MTSMYFIVFDIDSNESFNIIVLDLIIPLIYCIMKKGKLF